MTGPNRAIVAVLDPVTLQEPCREGWAQQLEQAQPPARINATANSAEALGTAEPAHAAVDDAESVDSLTEWLEPLDLRQWSPSRSPHSTLSHWQWRKLKVPSHLTSAHSKRAPKEGESWPLLAELQKVAVSPLPTLRFELMLNGKLCVCLLDSGASISAARDGMVREFEWPTAPARTPTGQSIQVTAYDGSIRDKNIALKSARIRIDGFRGELHLLVLPLSGEDVILGMDFLTAYKAQIDIASRTIRLTDAKGRSHLIQAPAELNCSDPSIQASLCSAKAAAKDIEQGATAYLTVVTAADNTNGTATATSGDFKPRSARCVGDVSDLKAKYSSIFQPITGLPPKRHVDHPIDLVPGAGTPCGPVYRLAPAEIDELRRQLDDLLAKGLIEPISSPFGAPVLFVKKKKGELRLCIDYRKLNSVTIKNAYPLPRIDELLDHLHGARVFSSLDLHSGYHQCRVREGDEEKTAFRTQFGSYQFKVLSFGLCFQRMMNDVFRKHLRVCVLVYLDDILIFSRSFEEHRKHLEIVFRLLQENQLHVKESKCKWALDQVDFLGHVVGTDGITMDPKKVEAIRNWPEPAGSPEACKSQIRSFVGLANYYRRLIRHFAHLASPLNELLKEKAEWKWGSAERTAFTKLKAALTSAPVFVHAPDPNLPFFLQTDASDFATGAVIFQKPPGGADPHVVAYASHKLKDAERRYPAHEKEMLAVITALEEWRHYLLGPHFTLYTDNSAVS
ncbi:MAG: hypothetical protein EOM68_12415, partial [Spirochaetia bacterium]|nr:hypothetical protein [Spirochaetia bacterium]